jgi:hypothetical protein
VLPQGPHGDYCDRHPEVYDTVMREQIALAITGATYCEITAADLWRV